MHWPREKQRPRSPCEDRTQACPHESQGDSVRWLQSVRRLASLPWTDNNARFAVRWILMVCFSAGRPTTTFSDPLPRSLPELRRKYLHLVWSNPDAAKDDIYLYAVLLSAKSYQILDFAAVLGLVPIQAA